MRATEDYMLGEMEGDGTVVLRVAASVAEVQLGAQLRAQHRRHGAVLSAGASTMKWASHRINCRKQNRFVAGKGRNIVSFIKSHVYSLYWVSAVDLTHDDPRLKGRLFVVIMMDGRQSPLKPIASAQDGSGDCFVRYERSQW